MNDQSDVPRLWARQGDAVACLNGHAICHIARDIYAGEARADGDFDHWHQPEPDRKASVTAIRCAQCKSVWIRGNPRDGYQFHFQDGWR